LNTDEDGTDVDGHHAVEVFENISVDCAPGESTCVADEDVKSAEDLFVQNDGSTDSFGGRLERFSSRFGSRSNLSTT
jgi:hypothetical protein